MISISCFVCASFTTRRMHGGDVIGRRSYHPSQRCQITRLDRVDHKLEDHWSQCLSRPLSACQVVPCHRIHTSEHEQVVVRYRGCSPISKKTSPSPNFYPPFLAKDTHTCIICPHEWSRPQAAQWPWALEVIVCAGCPAAAATPPVVVERSCCRLAVSVRRC